MAYIANRPVRFDRNYAIGETIPDGVIDPKMTTKLINMGRIIHIPDKAEPESSPIDSTERTTEGESGEGEESTQGDTQNAPDGNSDGVDGTDDGSGDEEDDEEDSPEQPKGVWDWNAGTKLVDGEIQVNPPSDPQAPADPETPKEYKCEECGKTFSSANALLSHSRVHKK